MRILEGLFNVQPIDMLDHKIKRRNRLLISLLALVFVAVFTIDGVSQEKLPSLKVISIKRVPGIQVGGDFLEREITMVLTNTTNRPIEIYGRYNGDIFDPSGREWQVDSKTGAITYFDPENPDVKKVILRKTFRVFTDLKLLQPGGEIRFAELETNITGCNIASVQTPLWFRFSGEREIRIIYSNKMPLGFERCIDYPGIEISP